jgi:hypothetical protein
MQDAVLSLNLELKYARSQIHRCSAEPDCSEPNRTETNQIAMVDKRENRALLKLTDTIYFLFWTYPSSNFLKKHNVWMFQ